jgi:type II secretory pathway pseudopilin PulG
LLVVLLILTVVIAIVVPTLASFRNTARKATTLSLMTSLTTSVAQFRMSQARLPGYFTPKEMGDPANNTNKFSAMENLMLDLAGGVTTDAPVTGTDPCDAAQFSVIQVGPTNKKVNVDTARVGAPDNTAKGQVSRGYFKPDPKFFVRQCKPVQRSITNTTDQSLAMPVLVDAWGQPILAWVEDQISGLAPLAADVSSTRAHFFRASNAAFVNSTALGRLGQNQTDLTTGSMLFGPGPGAAAASVSGIVGNPLYQGLPRGPIVFHSAGTNGVYIGRSERGGKQSSAPGNPTVSLPPPNGRDYFQEGDFDDMVLKAE